MRGYLSSLLGASLIFLLVLSYKAWFSLKDLDKSFSEYADLHRDIYKRAALENEVYTFLRDLIPLCEASLLSGSMKLSDCSELANGGIRAILLKEGIQAPPVVVQPVLSPDLRFVFVAEVHGRIGKAVFKIPLGAEVGG